MTPASLPPTRPSQSRALAADESSVFSLSFAVGMNMVEDVLALTEEWALEHGAYRDDCASLRLILEELLVNLCLHATPASGGLAERGGVRVDLRLEPVYETLVSASDVSAAPIRRLSGFRLSLRDSGAAFNPLEHQSREVGNIRNTPLGGRGLTLVRLLAGNIVYKRLPSANLLALDLVLSAPPSTDQGGSGGVSRDASPSGGGRLLRRAGALWRGNLTIRQTAFFFFMSLALLWGGVALYVMSINALRRETAQRVSEQAVHTQDLVIADFLEHIGRGFTALADRLSAAPGHDKLLEDDEAFFAEIKKDPLFFSLMADDSVLGVLKGGSGKSVVTLLYLEGGEPKQRFLPAAFGNPGAPLLEREASQWSGPLRGLPVAVSGRHTAVLLSREMGAGTGMDAWFGVIVAIPWLSESFSGFLGLADALTLCVSRDTEYIIYPPGRGPHSGPQSLREEAQGGYPPLARLLEAMGRGEKGMMRLDDPSGKKKLPWPVPWSGSSIVAYAPMSIPGWYSLLIVSSEKISGARLEVPPSMIALALIGPVFMGLLAWKISVRTVAPLKDLSASLERLAEGDLDTPLPPPRSRDEVSAMLRDFEQVRITLRSSFANLVEKTAAQQRMRNELALARSIQESMLPAILPRLPGIGVAAHIDIAGDVCGDLFDCFVLPYEKDCLYCLMGDVCGKGIPASIIMSRTMSLARSALLRGDSLPGMLERLNSALLRSGDALTFVTLLVARLDSRTGLLSWAAAGHPPPVLGDAAGAARESGQQPWSGELVLGVRPHPVYTERSLRLVPGQSVLLFTDGADEAMGPVTEAGREIFGTDSLTAAFISACRPPPGSRDLPSPQAALEATRAAVHAHMAGSGPFDDISLLVLRWDGPGET